MKKPEQSKRPPWRRKVTKNDDPNYSLRGTREAGKTYDSNMVAPSYYNWRPTKVKI